MSVWMKLINLPNVVKICLLLETCLEKEFNKVYLKLLKGLLSELCPKVDVNTQNSLLSLSIPFPCIVLFKTMHYNAIFHLLLPTEKTIQYATNPSYRGNLPGLRRPDRAL